MSPLRVLLTVALIALLSVSSAVIVLWTSPERSLRFVALAVKQFSPYELQLTNPQLQWSPFSFRADLVLVNYRDRPGPPLIALQAVDLNMSFRELLFGSISHGHFNASNVTYYLDEQLSDEPIDIEALLAPLSRLPTKLAVDSLHLISRTDNIWIFPLKDLSALRNAGGRWDLRAGAAIAQRQLSLVAQLGWRSLASGAHRLKITATLSGLDESSELRTRGYIDAAGADLSYELAVDGSYERVSDFLQAFDARAYNFGGNLSIRGVLRGSLDDYVLTFDELQLSQPKAYNFSASGTMAGNDSADVAIDLQATGYAREIEGLLPRDGPAADLLLHSELALKVAGTLAAPVLEQTSLVLYGAGESRVSISIQDQALELSQLSALSHTSNIHADLQGTVGDLGGLLQAGGVAPNSDVLQGQLSNVAASFEGYVHGTPDELQLSLSHIETNHGQYTLHGSSNLLWRKGLLSVPAVELRLLDNDNGGTLHAQGSIAELELARGVALQLSLDKLLVAPLLEALDLEPPVPLYRASGAALLSRATDTLRISNLKLDLEPNQGTELHITGMGSALDKEISADLEVQLTKLAPKLWSDSSIVVREPKDAHASLRLRPTYATVLADLTMGATQIQGIASADLDRNRIDELSLDLYTAHLHLDDFARPPQNQTIQTPRESWDLKSLNRTLPQFPMHLSLRSGEITGPLSRLSDLSVAIDTEPGRITLKELDTRYAGGELMLRGNADYRVSPPAISLAGRGIAMPMGAVTSDLGLQQTVSGSLSFQGGLITRGSTANDWRDNLQGRMSTALSDITVSGAAYDLLMSNLLVWLVKGANDKTTTFSCTMAQFDINAGVARSDSIYIETPRMLATGKAAVNLAKNSLDVRIEPRSKMRSLQFPSAVHIKGALNDPHVRVSPLQLSADLSAQALLLLPSLTLKLFGIDGPDNPHRPCQTQPL